MLLNKWTVNVRTYNVTWRRVFAKVLTVEKQNITNYECEFVACGTQHLLRLHHIVICGLHTYKYFCTLSHISTLIIS
jgi:hypothetical protein